MHAGAILAHVQFVDLAFVATALYLATGRLEHGPRVAAELGPMAEWAKTGSRPSVDALMSSWCTRLEGTPSITLPHPMALKQTIEGLSFESTLSAKMLAVVESKVMATATAATPTENASPATKRKEEAKRAEARKLHHSQ